ncbi:VCP-like ATPase [uncultured archaeon]|nr:VCP-like ATPase [uncultured archaeon]
MDDYGELSLEHEYHNLGNDYYKLGEFDKAIDQFNKALELRPDLLETYFNRGLAYTRKQEYDKALSDLTKVIQLNPNLAEAYYTRGLVYEYKQDYDKAIENYGKALEVDPNYSKAATQREVAQSKKASISSGGGGGGGKAASTPGAGGGGEGDNLTKFEVMKKPKMNFDDVAGLKKVKEQLKEAIVYPLSNPALAKRYGKTAGGGIIFYGPPGTGKTFIAKAAAGECAASFISVKASDIVDMYAGNTEKNIHNAFETARKNAPCIIFFDEMDGIAGKREGMDQSFEKRAINQFLMELDGAEYSNDGVLAAAGTNAPWDIDAALRRAGRFAKLIYFPEPDKDTRAGIVKLNIRNRPVDPKLPIGRIARLTEGYSSADIAELCDAAAAVPWREALKTGKERLITFKDFVKAQEGEEGVHSSLPPWYGSVKKKLFEDEEEDKDKDAGSGTFKGIFNDLLTLPSESDSGGGAASKPHVVKHKSEQKGLISEEERRQFSQLIRDIESRNSEGYKTMKKLKQMFARYVM